MAAAAGYAYRLRGRRSDLSESMTYKITYIRSVFFIGLKAGGSVGHTAGVISGLRSQTQTTVITNDELPEVDPPVRYIRPLLKHILPLSVLEALNNLQFCVVLKTALPASDFIYQRHSGLAFAGAWLSSRYCVPLILEFNSSDVWKIKNWCAKDNFLKAFVKNFYHKIFLAPLMEKVERYNLRQAKLIVVVSQVLKNDLVKQGVAAEKILVNPNGVDVEKFHPHCGGEGIRKKYALTGKTVVGFIGTFGQWHGVCELAQAIVAFFREAPQYRETTRFLLIGDGVLREELQKILQDGGAEDEVILTGLIPQEEAPKYLDACDIFVSPHIPNPDGTKFFGSPTKLFEYMAMGRGIVASDLEQIGDMLEHDKTACLVEPGNVTDLAKGIKALVDDEELRERLGKNARKKVIANYTWDKHVARILDAAESTLKE